MKMKALAAALFFGLGAFAAHAQQITINTVGLNTYDGYGGVYQVGGSGFGDENYWWMCIEPNGSSAGTFIADALSFLDGWDQQNTERKDEYLTKPEPPFGTPGEYYTTAIPMQVRVMEYVLDTYLPWHLAGPSTRFLEQSSNSANFGSNDEFYNAFFTIQHFLAEVYGNWNQTDFTDMSGYTAWAATEGNAFDLGDADAMAARQALYDLILDDVENKAEIPGFFETYNVQGTYMIANTQFPTADGSNYQDALIIVAPVPEPSGALLIGCAGVLVMFRRFRRLA